MNNYINVYEELKYLLNSLENFNKKKIPLCAAETYVSPFVKNILSSEFEGKYCMGNKNYDENEDFIGSNYIHKLFELLSYECRVLFGAEYSDARTLTGMNCNAVVISSLLKRGSHILLTTHEQGGHSSIPILLSLSGITFDEMPYDYAKYTIDYNKLNVLLSEKKYDALYFAQSDLLQAVDLSKIHENNMLIILDATQTLGMIASKVHPNPLSIKDNLVLIGGTHKTLPGPTCGLILTNNSDYINALDKSIGPKILRNVQPNNIAALLLSLLEQEKFGKDYQEKTMENANYLGKELEKCGYTVAKINQNRYTETHQLFLLTSEDEMNTIYNNARNFGITLNKKVKPLFGGFGIRIGVQEITRYGWDKKQLRQLANLLSEIKKPIPNDSVIVKLINYLNCFKNNNYSFLS